MAEAHEGRAQYLELRVLLVADGRQAEAGVHRSGEVRQRAARAEVNRVLSVRRGPRS